MLRTLISLIITTLLGIANAQTPSLLTQDSEKKNGVVYGEHIHTTLDNSTIFPGTTRDVDIYVPAGYDGKAACVCVIQDWMMYRADTVVSNLIASQEIPMMIVVASSPGTVKGDYDTKSPRANRTYEYDTPSARFGQFVLTELLPFVEKHKGSNGTPIKLSKDRNDRMITGCSSGAACAINAAWYTGEFARVYSACGSLTALRGSFANPSMVNKYETKDIRFYFQSGSEDMWTSFGDWWAVNQEMVRAMDFAGYDFDYEFTQGARHCDANAGRLFPKAMRFLWKDYPSNVPAAKKMTRNRMLKQILIEGEKFELMKDKINPESRLLTDKNGNLIIASSNGSKRLEGNRFVTHTKHNIIAIGKDDQMLASLKRLGLVIIDSKGKTKAKIKSTMQAYSAVPLRDGGFYIAGKEKDNCIWYLSPKNTLTVKEKGLKGVYSIALSANDNWLYAFEHGTRRGYSYKVVKNTKSLMYPQEFFYLYLRDEDDGTQVKSAIADNIGNTYLATALGIQVCDHNGRCEAIMTLPDGARPQWMAWGGKGRTTLYVLTENGNLYSRKLNAAGADPNGEMPEIRVGAG